MGQRPSPLGRQPEISSPIEHCSTESLTVAGRSGADARTPAAAPPPSVAGMATAFDAGAAPGIPLSDLKLQAAAAELPAEVPAANADPRPPGSRITTAGGGLPHDRLHLPPAAGVVVQRILADGAGVLLPATPPPPPPLPGKPGRPGILSLMRPLHLSSAQLTVQRCLPCPALPCPALPCPALLALPCTLLSGSPPPSRARARSANRPLRTTSSPSKAAVQGPGPAGSPTRWWSPSQPGMLARSQTPTERRLTTAQSD